MRQNGFYQQQQSLPIFTAAVHSLIQLERNSGVPLYRQICERLREAILAGELLEGTRLPTERALAHALGINRTTVMNAYNQLASEGLIEGHVGRGTVVKRTYFNQQSDDDLNSDMPSWLYGLDASEDAILGADARILSELAATTEQDDIISFAAASPAPDLLPIEIMHSILEDSLTEARELALGYRPVEGLQILRRGIAARMRKRGIPVDMQHILILSGSTQGIGLIARMLLNPGDEVVVETPTYLGALQTFRVLGARVIGVPTDNEGMRVDLLESILARRRPRFIYVQPTFHNPTGMVLSKERRRRLLTLARRYQTPILEDDPYGEMYYEHDAPQPLKAMDTHGHVLYLSTFSKILAPGLRVAWLVAPEPVIERLSLHKQIFDLNTSALSQWFVSEIIRRDLLDEHLARVRQHYHHKRDLMLQAIHTHWPAEVRVNQPQGGINLWCRLPGDMRSRLLLREAAQERVSFVIGEPFHVDGGGQNTMRLSYASAHDEQIEEGIRRIGTVMRRIQMRNQSRTDRAPIERIPMV